MFFQFKKLFLEGILLFSFGSVYASEDRKDESCCARISRWLSSFSSSSTSAQASTSDRSAGYLDSDAQPVAIVTFPDRSSDRVESYAQLEPGAFGQDSSVVHTVTTETFSDSCVTNRSNSSSDHQELVAFGQDSAQTHSAAVGVPFVVETSLPGSVAEEDSVQDVFLLMRTEEEERKWETLVSRTQRNAACTAHYVGFLESLFVKEVEDGDDGELKNVLRRKGIYTAYALSRVRNHGILCLSGESRKRRDACVDYYAARTTRLDREAVDDELNAKLDAEHGVASVVAMQVVARVLIDRSAEQSDRELSEIGSVWRSYDRDLNICFKKPLGRIE